MTKRKKLNVKIPNFNIEMSMGKQVGNALDVVLSAMEEQGFEVPLELEEIKQYLRFKGDSLKEQRNDSLWEQKNKMVIRKC